MRLAAAIVALVTVAQVHAQTCDDWAYLDPAPPVTARVSAYDPSRQSVLSFALAPVSTSISTAPAQSFEIQDGVWTTIASGPDLRLNAILRSATAMAFDAARNRMVLNGGTTWELVNGAWVQAATGFTARVMTFDATRGRIIAIGDNASLYEWDGAAWAAVATSGQLLDVNPTGPFFHDPSRDETWVFSGSRFTVRSAGTWGPRTFGPWSTAPLTAYVDPQSNIVHVITSSADYRWDGVAWESTPLTGWPVGLATAPRGAVWDPVRREAVVISTATFFAQGAPRAAVLRDRSWVTYSTRGMMPITLVDNGLVYDSTRERLIGNDSTGTVEIIGSEVRPLVPLSVRPLAYDPARDLVLGEALGVAYTMTGDRWNPAPAGLTLSPPSSATFDAARGRIVGISPGGASAVSVFSFADGQWSNEGFVSLLESWSRSWITFDPVRQESLLMLSDVGFRTVVPTRLESNGELPTFIAQSQVSQFGVSTAYDPNRAGLIATGGWHGADGRTFPRTTSRLRSDAVQWEQIAPVLPSGRKYHGTAYDAVRERVVIWGGTGEGDFGGFVGTTPMYLGFGPAAIVRNPSAVTTFAGSTVQLRVVAKGGGHLQYRWRKNGVDIHDTVRRLGTARDVLTISNLDADDAGLYSVRVFNPCGNQTSVEVPLRLCPADINLDGAVDSDDTIRFFAAWETGDQDIDGDGDTDGDDVIAFFIAWDGGC